MRQAIVKRRFSHNGVTHQPGDAIEIPDSQFNDWRAVGLVAAKPRPRSK